MCIFELFRSDHKVNRNVEEIDPFKKFEKMEENVINLQQSSESIYESKSLKEETADKAVLDDDLVEFFVSFNNDDTSVCFH